MNLWPKRSDTETVRLYVEAINAADFSAVAELLSENASITDTSGSQVSGRDACVEIIRRAREMAPDYKLEIGKIGRRGDDMLIFGTSWSSDPRISGATQFRVRADHQFVHEWQSYSERPTRTIDHISKSLGQVRDAE